MKKNLLSLFVVLFAAVACGNKNQNTDQNVAERKTISLSKKDFLNKVWNFEADSLEWNHLGDKPAIIDFYADWCAPCKAIEPTLEELAHEYYGQIYIYKVNVDKERALAEALNIQSLPTLLFVPMEGEVNVVRGRITRAVFKEHINNFLLRN